MQGKMTVNIEGTISNTLLILNVMQFAIRQKGSFSVIMLCTIHTIIMMLENSQTMVFSPSVSVRRWL